MQLLYKNERYWLNDEKEKVLRQAVNQQDESVECIFRKLSGSVYAFNVEQSVLEQFFL